MKANIATSSTSKYPTPKDVYLYLLSKLEAIATYDRGDFAVFQVHGESERGVQVETYKEFEVIRVKIYGYPYDEEPNQLVSRLDISFPTGYMLSHWKRQSFALFAMPKCPHSEIANTIDELFTKLLGAPQNYVVEGWVEQGGIIV